MLFINLNVTVKDTQIVAFFTPLNAAQQLKEEKRDSVCEKVSEFMFFILQTNL